MHHAALNRIWCIGIEEGFLGQDQEVLTCIQPVDAVVQGTRDMFRTQTLWCVLCVQVCAACPHQVLQGQFICEHILH